MYVDLIENLCCSIYQKMSLSWVYGRSCIFQKTLLLRDIISWMKVINATIASGGILRDSDTLRQCLAQGRFLQLCKSRHNPAHLWIVYLVGLVSPIPWSLSPSSSLCDIYNYIFYDKPQIYEIENLIYIFFYIYAFSKALSGSSEWTPEGSDISIFLYLKICSVNSQVNIIFFT